MSFDFLLAAGWNGATQTSQIIISNIFDIGILTITIQDLQSRLRFIKMLGSGSL